MESISTFCAQCAQIANTLDETVAITSYDFAMMTLKNVASASFLPAGLFVSDMLVSLDGKKLHVGNINFAADAAHSWKAGQPAFYIPANQ